MEDSALGWCLIRKMRKEFVALAEKVVRGILTHSDIWVGSNGLMPSRFWKFLCCVIGSF